MAAHAICFDFYYQPLPSRIGQNTWRTPAVTVRSVYVSCFLLHICFSSVNNNRNYTLPRYYLYDPKVGYQVEKPLTNGRRILITIAPLLIVSSYYYIVHNNTPVKYIVVSCDKNSFFFYRFRLRCLRWSHTGFRPHIK